MIIDTVIMNTKPHSSPVNVTKAGTQMKCYVTLVLLLLLASCKRTSRTVVDEHKLYSLVLRISISGGSAIDDLRSRLTWLAHNAAWDVKGIVLMLKASQNLATYSSMEEIERTLNSGVSELEEVISERTLSNRALSDRALSDIASHVRSLQNRLGVGNCSVTSAPKEIARRAKKRLTSLPSPPKVSSDLTLRIESLRARAGRVGPFFLANCEEGLSPVLFGWIDDVPVPLPDLFEHLDVGL